MKIIATVFIALILTPQDCPHDGKHGDRFKVTVEHNGRKASREVSAIYLIESRPQDVTEAALEAFRDTCR